MNRDISTIGAALIGAVLGSFGAAFFQYFFRERESTSRQQRRIVQRYLLQLQDAAESLWLRFENLAERSGQSAMENEYRIETTVYAWARVIAYSRILLLDGIYAQLDHRLAKSLKTGFDKINQILKDDDGFQHYDRIALAEAVMIREGAHWRPRTYLEFRTEFRTVNSALVRRWSFDSAAKMVDSFEGRRQDLKEVRTELKRMLKQIAEKTKAPLSGKLKQQDPADST